MSAAVLLRRRRQALAHERHARQTAALLAVADDFRRMAAEAPTPEGRAALLDEAELFESAVGSRRAL